MASPHRPCALLPSVFSALVAATAGAVAPRAAEQRSNPFVVVDPDEDATYRKTIRDGVAEYQARRFEEARSYFRRAHEISPSARTLRGMGMAAFELRDYAAAFRSLSAALLDTRKPLSPEQRQDVEGLLERSRMFVDVYAVKLAPDDARMLVDGRAPELATDGTLVLGFGTHTVEATAPGRATLSRTIDVRGGSRKDLELSLPLALAPHVPATRAESTLSAALPVRATPVSRSSAAPWLWTSAGAALLASGAGIYWARQASQLSDCRSPKAGLRCTDESTLAAQRTAAMTTTLVAGAAALTLAVIGILRWDPGPPPSRRHSRLDCSASPFGIACATAF
jgi:tetratricopeptide (TPR) repeat protein